MEGIQGTATSSYTVSESGTLVYLPAPGSELGDLVILGEAGSERVVSREPRVFHSPSFSPDGRQVAVGVEEAGVVDIWVYDVSTRTARRLTTGGGDLPIWTRDGSRIAYSASATPGRVAGITWQPSSGGPEALLPEGDALPRGWSPDGRELIHFDIDLETRRPVPDAPGWWRYGPARGDVDYRPVGRGVARRRVARLYAGLDARRSATLPRAV